MLDGESADSVKASWGDGTLRLRPAEGGGDVDEGDTSAEPSTELSRKSESPDRANETSEASGKGVSHN